ncbi:hypothetical protein [Streptomyces sp. SYSU K217416]
MTLRRTGNLAAGSSLYGSATVHRRTAAGAHPVVFACDPSGPGMGGPGIGGPSPGDGRGQATIHLTVTSGAAPGPVAGGLNGMSPGQVAVGGGLVAAVLGAGMRVLRRRGGGGGGG